MPRLLDSWAQDPRVTCKQPCVKNIGLDSKQDYTLYCEVNSIPMHSIYTTTKLGKKNGIEQKEKQLSRIRNAIKMPPNLHGEKV